MSEPTIDQQQALAVHNVSKNMNISIERDVQGITVIFGFGRKVAVATKRLGWRVAIHESAEPCEMMYRGSSSLLTPKEALECADLITKAAQIGLILDETKEFPKRLGSSMGYVHLELNLAEDKLQIAILGDGGAANAFDIFANLLSILSKATKLPTEALLNRVDADSLTGLRLKLSPEQFQNLVQYASPKLSLI